MSAFIATFLQLVNEILAAGIVIIATSLLLYNLSRNMQNRVARSSGAILATVTLAYVADVFVSLGPTPNTAVIAGRIQWIGLAFMPATLFHLSDALLATTGLPSRGRRRAVVRILYSLSIVFSVAAVFTNTLAIPTYTPIGVQMQAQPVFWIYFAYYVTAIVVTFIFVNRARRRCLTDSTERRMAYLQVAILTPAVGIFPYSVFLPAVDELSLFVQVLVNIANIVVIIMLIFLSYPLSFFGSDVPDRVVKVGLMKFLLRGPGTGILALVVIVGTRRATDILSLPGEDFMPFAVVAAVMLWQWMIVLGLPYLERWLVYANEDAEQLSKVDQLSERMLTHNDLTQVIEATLEAICDYLRTEVAFVATLNSDAIEVITINEDKSDGQLETLIADTQATLRAIAEEADRVADRSAFQTWEDYQIVPLYSRRTNGDTPHIIGIMGIYMQLNPLAMLDAEDHDLLYAFVRRAEQTLDDMVLQTEIFAALEGLLPQFNTTRRRAEEVEYKAGRTKPQNLNLPNNEELYEQVRAALKHYWGGPGMSRSRLIDLHVVQDTLEETDTPVNALRSVLQEALEKLKPENAAERTMTAAEWTMYNIIDLRFIEGRKVREVARRMSISEADLYRKQRAAIQAVADSLLDMERETAQR
jgi:predicted DNA-binding protein (UPF0251 family)